MVSTEAVKKMADKLWKSPNTKNWEEFAKILKKSGIKYYKTFYANGKLKRLEDLTESYALLYDGRYRVITKVPVYKTISKGIEGALIYLMGLQNANLVD